MYLHVICTIYVLFISLLFYYYFNTISQYFTIFSILFHHLLDHLFQYSLTILYSNNWNNYRILYLILTPISPHFSVHSLKLFSFLWKLEWIEELVVLKLMIRAEATEKSRKMSRIIQFLIWKYRVYFTDRVIWILKIVNKQT